MTSREAIVSAKIPGQRETSGKAAADAQNHELGRSTELPFRGLCGCVDEGRHGTCSAEGRRAP